MYQSHFNFKNPPFRKATRLSGEFFVPYHQDIINLLKEKTQQAGITGLFCNDAQLSSQFSDALNISIRGMVTINAFPKLSASNLLYKLSPETQASKCRIHAVDTVLRQWQDASSSRKVKSKVLVISHTEAMKDSCFAILGMLLTRAQELDVHLSIVLMGCADQKSVLLQHAGLQEFVHTHHVVRPLTCRETLSYMQMQCEEQGCTAPPFSSTRIRKMHALTQGNVSKLNALAHLAMLAAWTERAATVGPRHLRLAAGEILPAKPRRKRMASLALFASVLFAACGWYLTPTISAKLPVQLPVPASWKPQISTTAAPVIPVIDNEMVNQPDAMHQLYLMWGYDASAEEALCQNAEKVNLACKQGTASLDTLASEGYPWVSEMQTGHHLNYAVVARVGDNSMDLLINGRTWQVSRGWFNQHATGKYTLLHRLTPQGKEAINAASSRQDLAWFDKQLSLVLAEPETHAQHWTAEMEKRTREFQLKMKLHADGIPGEETLMRLMREANTTPGVLIQAPDSTAHPATRGKNS
ncbi:peptidoglycan-binding protein [Enterobacter sp. RHBSTW-00994]|uniref:peptidoglycan-binding protein n=1 Tax=Enterobacteriaceae TaxID=543 RepID=UPI0015E987FF|nr:MULTISPECIES: peptidoglycan-binding protein [Enterobacteriaceae]MBM3073622.1 peptidoglycan-binding protein [Lelliottia sp. RWM.1]QLR42472.1 peptidoglycan-binding protein [Enterobacter sp. RHBSTW-00994]